MDIAGYLVQVQKTYATGAATEHSYRSALESLFSSVSNDVKALNEPKRVACGAPDFIIQRGRVVIGHAEAKDITRDLKSLSRTEADQKKRYLKALPNLVYTNCLDFEFYRRGSLVARHTIGDLLSGVQPRTQAFDSFVKQMQDFAAQRPQTISSSERLAEIIAGKAVLIKEILFRALGTDRGETSELFAQYQAFQDHLIHDISQDDFSDIYAETIAYGMFAARLHVDPAKTFTREEALACLPRSNPFLRSLFTYIAGHDLDDRIRWVIDDLADVFQACDLPLLMRDFGSLTGRADPFLHFYETFLAAYNPKKRKARGVWYTPEPVVNFIVRAVHTVLEKEFKLSQGIADTSKIKVNWDTGQSRLTKKGTIAKSGKNQIVQKELHRVQILDPATGTGTFLAEVIKQIAEAVQAVAPGMWSSYVETDLIPRVHGFELLMASYAMCHLKLDMVLTELGYRPAGNPPRLGVYLTNSLEEGEPANQSLPFAQWLSNEVRQANMVKRDLPIMCVVGNPPYSGISQNMGEWISGLIEPYKYVDGVHFGEKKHWLHDDYVKFIRLAERLIEKNEEGVLGFITNHGYLSNPTFRGMRQHLLRTFDKIYIADLHGNANKKERSPDGSSDHNVFDIRQGVAIIIAYRTRSGSKTKPMAEVWRRDLWGDRAGKQQALWAATLDDGGWRKIDYFAPYYMFYSVDPSELAAYDAGTSLADIFMEKSVGAVTGRDAINVSFTQEEAEEKIRLLTSLSEAEVRRSFGLGDTDARDWTVKTAQKDAEKNADPSAYSKIQYRPFDLRYTCYTGKSRGLYASPQKIIMKHLTEFENFGLCYNKTIEQERPFSDVFVFDELIQHHSLSLKEVNYIAPLYLYPEKGTISSKRKANIEPAYLRAMRKHVPNLSKGPFPQEVAIFNYIYGVLHAPSYRKRFIEFLRIDFPKIPWPVSADVFWRVAAAGEQLRQLHLLRATHLNTGTYAFVGNGNGVVEHVRYEHEGVWINTTQHFQSVPEVAWSYPVGGYQPAHKWLKDRKGRELLFDDIQHYQTMIAVLVETDRIVRAIDLPLTV